MDSVKYMRIIVPMLDIDAKRSNIFRGLRVVKRLNLLGLPSNASVRQGLLDANGCFDWSNWEHTTLTMSFLDASSPSCSSTPRLSIRHEPLRDRALVIFGLPEHFSGGCTRLSISKTTFASLSLFVCWLCARTSISEDTEEKLQMLKGEHQLSAASLLQIPPSNTYSLSSFKVYTDSSQPVVVRNK